MMQMENRSFNYIFNDILSKVLQLSENPSEFADYLTQQIRGLIGARTIVISVKSETDPLRVFSVFPVRRTAWANQPEVLKLAELSLSFDSTIYLDQQSSDASILGILQQLQMEQAISIPLMVGGHKVGVILLLEIMDIYGIESIIDVLNQMAGVFALIIRNAYLFQNMENLVKERTLELQAQNEELVSREQELQLVNEEFQVLNEELTENIKKTEDINRQLVEAKLRAEQSELQARDILQTAMDGFWIMDLSGRFIEVNDVICDMLGFSKEELLTMGIVDIQDEEHEGQSEKFIATLCEKRRARFESKFVRKNDSVIAVEVSTVFQPLQQVIVAFMSDITDRKQAEIDLSESEKRFTLAMNASHDGLFDWNLETNEIYYSPSWKLMLGYADHELPNDFSIWEDLTEPEDVKKSWELQQKLIHKEVDRFILEFKMKHKQGHWIDVLSRAQAVFNEQGKAVRIVGTHTDITDRIKSKKDLIKAKERAEESDRLKSAFLANMSHEIRTPMNGILGFAQLLRKPELTGEKQQSYINVISKSGERMLNIINDIINISKIESNQMEVLVADTHINEQIDFIYDFFKNEINVKGIQLQKIKGLPDIEAVIKTDQEKVYAILTNLVKNAIKFTDEGLITFGYTRKGSFLEFFVKDSGKGISAEVRNIIFERFRQGSENLTRNYEGAGLGLSITKAYVEMLGGNIWVESEVGVGSSFYFTLPYEVSYPEMGPGVEVDADRSTEILSKKIKVLIVEDDKISMELIKEMIFHNVREFIWAKSGVEAIEMCRNHPDIDLVLMDIKMPVMDGYKATRQIRLFNKEVLIVAQSAYALIGDREKAIEAGCNDYVTKPIDREVLLHLIDNYF